MFGWGEKEQKPPAAAFEYTTALATVAGEDPAAQPSSAQRQEGAGWIEIERSWYQQQMQQMEQLAQMQQLGNMNPPSYPTFTVTTTAPGMGYTALPGYLLGADMADGLGGGVGASSGGYGIGAAAPAAPSKRQVVEEPSREMLKRVAVDVGEIELIDPRQKLAAEAEKLLGYTPLRKELRTPGTLRRVLAKLEIAILDEQSVNQYKGQMVEHYRSANKMPSPTWRLTPLRNYAQPVPEFVLQKAVEIKRELPEAQFYIDQLAVDPFLIVSLKELTDWSTNRQRQLDAETAAYVEAWAEPKFEATL